MHCFGCTVSVLHLCSLSSLHCWRQLTFPVSQSSILSDGFLVDCKTAVVRRSG